jgi:perosamine synthetase
MSYVADPEHPLTIAAPYFPAEEREWLATELAEILGGILSTGPRVRRFEQEFAAFCGAAQGVAFPSGTAALEAALVALGVRSGDEVLVPVQTFVATGMAVHLVGGTPVFTEVSGDDFGMDFEDAWARTTDRTAGAIVVHFGGRIPAGLPAFVERMRASGRFVIEDAAHAHGAELGGGRAGSFGDAGCFSFYPTKIMTTGEGGMLVTSRPEVERVARSLQSRGLDLDSPRERYLRPGRNNRFTEIAASMGQSQLRCLPGFLRARRAVAEVYDAGLGSGDLLAPQPPAAASRSSYWRYVTLAREPFDREALKIALAEDGISVDWAYDPPLHLQPVFRDLLGTRPGMLPRSESLMARHLCLPVNARMRPEDAEHVLGRVLHRASGLPRAVGSR